MKLCKDENTGKVKLFANKNIVYKLERIPEIFIIAKRIKSIKIELINKQINFKNRGLLS